jgi:uncharacterized protein YdaU (DUF1376 family)
MKPGLCHDFPIMVQDWLSSTAIGAMSLEQEAAYLRLLLYAWSDPDCALDDDPASLAAWSRAGKNWKKICGPVLKCFIKDPQNGRLYNFKQREVRRKQQNRLEEAKTHAQRAADARWAKRKQVSNSCPSNARALPEHPESTECASNVHMPGDASNTLILKYSTQRGGAPEETSPIREPDSGQVPDNFPAPAAVDGEPESTSRKPAPAVNSPEIPDSSSAPAVNPSPETVSTQDFEKNCAPDSCFAEWPSHSEWMSFCALLGMAEWRAEEEWLAQEGAYPKWKGIGDWRFRAKRVFGWWRDDGSHPTRQAWRASLGRGPLAVAPVKNAAAPKNGALVRLFPSEVLRQIEVIKAKIDAHPVNPKSRKYMKDPTEEQIQELRQLRATLAQLEQTLVEMGGAA